MGTGNRGATETMNGLSYYEFAIDKKGALRKEKKNAYLSSQFVSLLKEYHGSRQQECLYQHTTGKHRQEKSRWFWDLWIQTYAKSEEHAIGIANNIRNKILSKELPNEGLLNQDGTFLIEANFSGEILQVYYRTYKLILIFQQYNIDVKIGAEVGVQVGANAIPLLKRLPNLHLLLIDNYDDSLHIHRRAQYELKETALNRFAELQHNTTWIMKPSVEAAKEVDNGSLDYVYIDAMHDYDSVKQDIEAWVPKVRIGGLITGHDFTARYKGLKKAVRERFGNKFSNDGDVWYIQKTEEM